MSCINDTYHNVGTAEEISEKMIEVFNHYKNDKENISEEGYIKVYFAQMYIPSLWSDIEEIISKNGLWLETGEGDGTDIFICG